MIKIRGTIFDEAKKEKSFVTRSKREPYSEIKKEIKINEEEKEEKEKLEELIDESRKRTLYELTNIFPFDFFPDRIVINKDKIDIVHKVFWLSGEVRSITISQIKDVLVDAAIVFATLKIVLYPKEETISVGFLHKKEAIKAKRIIEGLVIAFRQNIDLKKIKEADLSEKIEELAKTQKKVEEELVLRS